MKLSLKAKKIRVQKILETLHQLFPEPISELEYNQPYELVLAVIMSAQTTDVQVNKVTRFLFQKYPTLESFANADPEELAVDMHGTGFFRAKSRNVILTSQMLLKTFGGVVPSAMKDLITLPGAARKTANVLQRELFNIHEGVAVDTHIIRLANQLKLTESLNPVIIERDLMKITPPEEWGMISIGLILYGRRFWKARQPDKGILSLNLGLL